MMRLRDAGLLAFTKFRTRGVRTIITIAVSGLLFAVLIGALVAWQGIQNSMTSFSQEGLNGRYIVSATADSALAGGDAGILRNIAVQKRAQQLYDDTVAAKTAAAKKLAVDYDPATEPLPLRQLGSGDLGRPVKTILNIGQSPAVSQAIKEYLMANPVPGIEQLKIAASAYHPKSFAFATSANPDGTIATMRDGAEIFGESYGSGAGSGQDILQSGQLALVDSRLTNPFILTSPKNSDPNAVPLIVPYSEAEKLLNLPVLAKNASADQHLNRIKQLYVEAATTSFTGCYRNSLSTQQLQLAITQANSQAVSIQQPIRYGLPEASLCAPANVTIDTRTAAEKATALRQQQFDAQFSTTSIEPLQQKLTFRIAGLYPNATATNNTTMGNLLQTVTGSSLGSIIAIPSDLLNQMPNAEEVKALLFPTSDDYFGFPLQSYFVEFSNAKDAARFIDEKSCTTRADGTCATPTRLFQLATFGSNSVALGDVQQKFTSIFTMATLGVAAIAAVIMSTTIGRMIADGRRETAVFRAIGARRGDIVTIYALYTLCLSVCVALFALGAGLIIAATVDHFFWAEATIQAQLLMGASDDTRQFHFFGIPLQAIGVVLLVALGSGLLSMLWPLVRNVRRNPIKDMRDE